MKFKKILLIFLSLLLLSILVWKMNILSALEIDITSDIDCATNQELFNEVNLLDKKWLDLLSHRIEDNLKRKYLCIKDVDLSYQFPRTMKIMIYRRNFLSKVLPLKEPFNLLESEASPSSEAALVNWSFPEMSSDEALIVDNTGFVFTKKPASEPLPVLFLPENLTLGTQLDTYKFNLIEKIFEKYPQISQISDRNNLKAKTYGSFLLIDSSPKIAFSLERDILKQLASLQLILQKAKIDQRVVITIDLRFDKPVVEYQPKLSK